MKCYFTHILTRPDRNEAAVMMNDGKVEILTEVEAEALRPEKVFTDAEKVACFNWLMRQSEQGQGCWEFDDLFQLYAHNQITMTIDRFTGEDNEPRLASRQVA